MPRRVNVVLGEEEREVLERWARRPTSAQALALRCRIVLAAAEGEQSKEIAVRLGCSTQTVGRWRGRFAKRGLDGLHDEPRPGKPRQIGDEEIERVIVKTLEESPPNATHWSTRSMAAQTGMSQSAISRIWRAFGLKPHSSPRSAAEYSLRFFAIASPSSQVEVVECCDEGLRTELVSVPYREEGANGCRGPRARAVQPGSRHAGLGRSPAAQRHSQKRVPHRLVAEPLGFAHSATTTRRFKSG